MSRVIAMRERDLSRITTVKACSHVQILKKMHGFADTRIRAGGIFDGAENALRAMTDNDCPKGTNRPICQSLAVRAKVASAVVAD
ncbi:hypothetical protein AB6A40_011570 [Gnathostoma spinigerum]|uniref:Uncharacterized protein n=1 Tax=Gnathostoma spinigerum TaxID=75299 RepID=A0ABD6EY63_9BILA